MRFFKALQNFIKLSLALIFAIGAFFCVKAAHISKLSFLPGERAYYLDSASSQSLIKTKLTAWDLFRVKGESVSFTLNLTEETGEKEETEAKEDFARALVSRYGGEILFKEEVCGTVSYYAYIPTWGQGITLYGKQVNLHIAVSESQCKVGTPIIFGGF